jgi:hypothetical protein
MAKKIDPSLAGTIAGFLGSLVFISIMTLVPVTLFMKLMQLAMPFMPQINFFGWVLHAVVNAFWGFLFAVIVDKYKVKRLYLAAIGWSLVLLALILVAVPLVGLQLSTTLLIVELFAYLNYATVLWPVYSLLAKR